MCPHPSPSSQQFKPFWNADAPVEFTYAGSTVNTEQAGNEIPVTANVGAGLTTFTATFNFPEGADTLYLAMVNRTSDGGVIGNIRLTNVNTNCPEPEPEPQPEPEPEPGAGEGGEGGEEEEKDGGCASTKPNALLFLLAGLGLMVLRRRLSN